MSKKKHRGLSPEKNSSKQNQKGLRGHERVSDRKEKVRLYLKKTPLLERNVEEPGLEAAEKWKQKRVTGNFLGH